MPQQYNKTCQIQHALGEKFDKDTTGVGFHGATNIENDQNRMKMKVGYHIEMDYKGI